MNAKQIIIQELNELKRRITDNFMRSGQNASGKTINSLHVEDTDTGAALYGIYPFSRVETGRKPGKVPYGLSGIIYQWSKDKGINFQKNSERKSFSYLVARKIANEGTALYRAGGRNDIYSNEIQKTIDTVNEKLGKNILQEAINIIKTNN